MSEGVFPLPRICPTTDPNSLKQYANPTAFGTTGIVLSAKAGRLYKMVVNNSNATTSYFVQLHNKATAPINTDAAILWEQRVEAAVGTTGTSCVFDFSDCGGLYFSLGISLALSSTKGVLTLAAATDGTAYALYTATTT